MSSRRPCRFDADTGKARSSTRCWDPRHLAQGWFANTVHAASPVGWSHFDEDRWELFHIEADRSQCHDLAAEHPEKLEELKALWFAEAAKYNGLPLADLGIFETLAGGDRISPKAARRTPTTPRPPKWAWRGRRAPRPVVLGPRRGRRRRGGCGGRALQTRRRPRRARAVRRGRPPAVRLQLHGRRRATGVLGRPVPLGATFGVSYQRSGTVRAATPPSGTSRCTSTGRSRRGGSPCTPRHVRPGRRGSGRRPQPRPGGLGGVPGAVPVHRWNHRQGRRRHPGTPYRDVERELAQAFSKD